MPITGYQLIEWSVATQAAPGEEVSGDLHMVKPFRGDSIDGGPARQHHDGVLVAVMDGLGHGEEAATAARMAVATLEERPYESVIALLRRCHQKLVGTRGLVMSLASFDGQDETMTWTGLGNVEGILLRKGGEQADHPAREALVTRGGIAGYQLPLLRAYVLPVQPGDTLILSTDGIDVGFADKVILEDSPQQIADRILDTYRKGIDDALVLVARWNGLPQK